MTENIEKLIKALRQSVSSSSPLGPAIRNTFFEVAEILDAIVSEINSDPDIKVVTPEECPNCGSDRIGDGSSANNSHWFFCENCDHRGPLKETIIDALDAWNAIARETAADNLIHVNNPDLALLVEDWYSYEEIKAMCERIKPLKDAATFWKRHLNAAFNKGKQLGTVASNALNRKTISDLQQTIESLETNCDGPPVTLSELDNLCAVARTLSNQAAYWHPHFMNAYKQGQQDGIQQCESRIAELEAKQDAPKELSFDDAIKIAKGCIDYGGGYRAQDGMLAVFHHGINTVVHALEGAAKTGMSDLQSQILHRIGSKD